jgi:hypothetical protein
MATRQQIRTAIKALVETEFTTVFDYRPSQIFDEDLPCCSIFFEDGETERDFDEEGITDGRLVIESMVRASGNIDAALDEKGALVEAQIKQSNLLSNIVEYISRTGFAYARDPESNSGALSQIFTVHYLDED